MNEEVKKINKYTYKVEKQGDMNTSLKIFASPKIMEKIKSDKSIQQGINVAKLPGIVGESIMMPDAHQGYGFSIGGVAALDKEKGCISPGGVGFDINCGVRLLTTNVTKDVIYGRIKELLNTLFKNIPAGVGGKSQFKLSVEELDKVLLQGPRYMVKKGYGTQEDVTNCESEGMLKDANPSKVSKKAKQRGKSQLGTLGSGNHFLEVQFVSEIHDKEKAKTFGITRKNQVVILIHSGSRGFGHQVCSDYLRKMEDAYPKIIKNLPDKNLVYAPAGSKLATEYYEAMCSAANYAWTNRHMLGVQTRKSFKAVFGEEIQVDTVYDVAHNIAKLETYEIDGKDKEVWVHRKGATRAFGPNNPEIPKKYQKTGQPIFIPGSMGTSSYVLAGTNKSMTTSFGSTPHGAGRIMSRTQAKKTWNSTEITNELKSRKIYIKAASKRGITEEAPGAYKDVDEVVKVTQESGIGVIVAKLKPIGVVKG